MRLTILILLLQLVGSLKAQNSALLKQNINLKPAVYKTADILKILEENEIIVNYSNAAILNQTLEIKNSPVSVQFILESIFNFEKYSMQLKGNKILIVPKANKNIHTYSGFIEEGTSGERLIGVNLVIPDLQIGTTTNAYGYYSLTVPAYDTLNLLVSSLGYENLNLKLYPGMASELDLEMRIQQIELTEVTVTDAVNPSELVQMSENKLSYQQINAIPAVLGEADVLRSLQYLPGVMSANEASSGIFVRGGSPDQNLILLDGVPVYNSSHLFGFFSIFNPDAIKNVTLTKGGFPARYGGRLSSVVSIDMKDGHLREFHGTGSLGIISSKFSVEGPLVKDKSSFILSARRTWLDLLLKSLLNSNNLPSYYFGDVNLKLNYKLNRKDRVYLSVYGGRDKLSAGLSTAPEETMEAYLKWGNFTTALRHSHIYNPRLFGNFTATFSNYRFIVGASITKNENKSAVDFYTQVRDYGLKYDLEFHPFPNHKFRGGISYTLHNFTPGTTNYNSSDKADSIINIANPILSNDAFYYLEDDWTINSHWKLNYGLHYSNYLVNSRFYHYLQPRLSARFLFSENWAVKASYAEMAQYIHLLTNSGIGLPTDLWVSSTENIKPQYSKQLALGNIFSFPETPWQIETELYHKWMRNLITYKDGGSYMNSSHWENTIESNGKGKSYGGELLVKYNSAKVEGWIAYTLAWSNRQFDNINNGDAFPYRYDRRHDINFVGNVKFTEKFEVGMSWVYGSGIAFTAPAAEYILPSSTDGFWYNYTQYSKRNAERMPSFHRLDLSVNFHKEKVNTKRTWSIAVYNVYNYKNPFMLYLKRDEMGRKELKQLSLLGIVPSISYTLTF